MCDVLVGIARLFNVDLGTSCSLVVRSVQCRRRLVYTRASASAGKKTSGYFRRLLAYPDLFLLGSRLAHYPVHSGMVGLSLRQAGLAPRGGAIGQAKQIRPTAPRNSSIILQSDRKYVTYGYGQYIQSFIEYQTVPHH